MIKNQWYAIAASSEIKENQLIGIKRLGINIALFRNKEGLNAVMDKCSHRGAALSKGQIKNDCVKCPFHGIEFHGDGSCSVIPANGLNSDKDYTRYNIKNFHTREINDIVYIWYGEEEPDHEPRYFKEIDDTYEYGELQDKWNTHYSRSIENQLDVVHLPFVHHNTIGRGNKTLVNGPKVEWLDDYTFITSANNEVDKGQKPLDNKESKIKKTNLQFKYPNTWLNTVSEKIKIMAFFAPVDEENTIMYIRFYNKITSIRILNKIIAYAGKYANFIVERQDKRVVETQMPKKSSFKSKENLLKGDMPIIEYRKKREELINRSKSKE